MPENGLHFPALEADFQRPENDPSTTSVHRGPRDAERDGNAALTEPAEKEPRRAHVSSS